MDLGIFSTHMDESPVHRKSKINLKQYEEFLSKHKEKFMLVKNLHFLEQTVFFLDLLCKMGYM
jgi:hypothetical protein